jgi:hypothetical protein
VVEGPARLEQLDVVGRLPHGEHVGPGRILRRGLESEAHGAHATSPYIHNDDAVIELVNPGRSLTETLELALGVDIEHEEPTYPQMPTCGRKERNPRLERDEVIESVEHTNHNVELFSERERSDISLYETSIWNTTPS